MTVSQISWLLHFNPFTFCRCSFHFTKYNKSKKTRDHCRTSSFSLTPSNLTRSSTVWVSEAPAAVKFTIMFCFYYFNVWILNKPNFITFWLCIFSCSNDSIVCTHILIYPYILWNFHYSRMNIYPHNMFSSSISLNIRMYIWSFFALTVVWD